MKKKNRLLSVQPPYALGICGWLPETDFQNIEKCLKAVIPFVGCLNKKKAKEVILNSGILNSHQQWALQKEWLWKLSVS